MFRYACAGSTTQQHLYFIDPVYNRLLSPSLSRGHEGTPFKFSWPTTELEDKYFAAALKRFVWQL